MTKDEMIEQLLQQVNSLTATINAQTQLISKLNQTIQELKEQLNKNSRNSSKPPSSDGFKKPAPKSLRKPSGKKAGGQDGHKGTNLAVMTAPDEIIKHMPSACEGCPHYQMCRGTACIAEKRHVIDAVVTISVTEHQMLEIPICMMHGDTRKGEFPSHVKATVQYGENLQALAVVLNTAGAVSINRTHEILSGVFNIPIATGTISSMVKRGSKGMEECDVLPAFHGIAMHDCRVSCWNYPTAEHAVCCAHLLRELTGIHENHPDGMSARVILNELLDGKTIDKARLQEMKEQKIIAHNLRASFEQIADDLNGVMSPLQKKMMRELLKHIDELNVHIKNLDDDIDHHMNADEKKAVAAISEIGGIADASAKDITKQKRNIKIGYASN